MARSKTKLHFWMITLVRQMEGDLFQYHPHVRGWVVMAKSPEEATQLIAKNLDNGPEGEFAGYTLEASVLEFYLADGRAAQLV